MGLPIAILVVLAIIALLLDLCVVRVRRRT